jgi:hypothetical protein
MPPLSVMVPVDVIEALTEVYSKALDYNLASHEEEIIINDWLEDEDNGNQGQAGSEGPEEARGEVQHEQGRRGGWLRLR